MAKTPFSNRQHFRDAFVAGLMDLLEQPELGAYILVHANASFDGEIFARLQGPLQQRFEQLAQSCRQALSHGRDLLGAPDDQAVFLKLMVIGFSGVQPTEFRREGEWEVQFNHIRSFRPKRMANTPVSGIYRPFDKQGFHFNKPFLRKEAVWSGELQGLEVELLYNKFPFTPLHGLLVPERFSREPQFLTHPYHLYVWALTEQLAMGLPGLGFGYNSYGAYASVNHLHFQMFQRDAALPLESLHWKHNQGSLEYPLDCEVYTSAQESWERLDELHKTETSYNLIYRPGRLYCLPRRVQGSYDHAAWTSGFAWHEMAGGITTFSRADYDGRDRVAISDEMAKLRLDPPDCSV